MKTIELIQFQVSKFNLLSNEKLLSFSIGIYEDGKLIEEAGTPAILKVLTDGIEYKLDLNYYWQERCICTLGNLINKLDYSSNYRKEALLFFTIYFKYFDEISKNAETKDTREDIKTIIVENYIERYDLKIEYNKKQMAELKETSDTFAKLEKDNEEYLKRISVIKTNINL